MRRLADLQSFAFTLVVAAAASVVLALLLVWGLSPRTVFDALPTPPGAVGAISVLLDGVADRVAPKHEGTSEAAAAPEAEASSDEVVAAGTTEDSSETAPAAAVSVSVGRARPAPAPVRLAIGLGASPTRGATYAAGGVVQVSTPAAAGGEVVVERRLASLTDGECGDFGPWAPTTEQNQVPDGMCAAYRYRGHDADGQTVVVPAAQVVRRDDTPPAAPAVSITESQPDEAVSGTTLFYRPTGGQSSFTVSASSRDGESGLESLIFPDLPGAPGATVSAGEASRTYTWTLVGEVGGRAVVATNDAGLRALTALTFAADAAPPAGGTVSYADGYLAADGGDEASGPQLAVSADPGSDALSGIEAGSAVLEQRVSALAGGSCAPFEGDWAPVAEVAVPAQGTCTQLRYRISDRVGNEAVYESTAVARYDATPPSAPTLVLESGAYTRAVGSTLFYNPALVESPSLSVTATGGDAESGIASASFSALAGAEPSLNGLTAAYAWPAGSAPAGGATAVVTSGAGASSSADFGITPDASAPVGGSVLASLASDGVSVFVSMDPGTDEGSGIDTSVVLERADAPFDGAGCGEFGTWAPASAADTIPAGSCVRYRMTVSDLVGNQSVYVSNDLLPVPPPAAVFVSPAAGSIVSGSVSLDVANASVAGFEVSPAGAGAWSPVGSPWDTTSVPDGAYEIRALGADGAVLASTSVVVANAVPEEEPPTEEEPPAEEPAETPPAEEPPAPEPETVEPVEAPPAPAETPPAADPAAAPTQP
jgi:hypothetical protein